MVRPDPSANRWVIIDDEHSPYAGPIFAGTFKEVIDECNKWKRQVPPLLPWPLPPRKK